MAKNYSNKNRTRKSLIAILCATAITCTGLAAACATENEEETKSTPSREDSQLLKNGSFEYFTVPDDAVYLINGVNNWTNGGSSSVMSGVIGTTKSAWDKLTDPELKSKLDYNNDLSTDDDEYVDYNKMKSSDMLYKDSYSALLEDDALEESKISLQGVEDYYGIKEVSGGYEFDGTKVYKNGDDGQYYFDAEFTKPVRKAFIDNPASHYGNFNDDDTKVGDKPLYKDDDGYLYIDEEKTEPVGNVLMIHNYYNDGKYNGLQQHYTSSSITIDANTSAEISLWVKTSNLRFDQGYSALNEQDKGAYIEVIQTVSSKQVDSFVVKSINTEKIIANAKADGKTLSDEESNGWLKYTIYVNGCDFASSSIQLRLGLGYDGEDEKCTGYAFFDDVTVTKYRSLGTGDSSYWQHETAIKNSQTLCSLTSEKEDKVFIADKELRTSGDDRNQYDFYYLVDLASEMDGNSYQTLTFGTDNVKAGLTTEKVDDKIYATAEVSNKNLNVVGVDYKDDESVTLYKNTEARHYANDIIGAFSYDNNFEQTFSSIVSAGYKDYSKVLNDALKGDGALDGAKGNMLVTLSAWGSAYTSTITNGSFTLAKSDDDKTDKYMLVSFWVKTSDMDGKTAATVKIYDVNNEKNSQSLTIDSTNVKTNFEDEKDIYNGWVPCFFFVKNDTKETQTFAIDFSFGNTSISSAVIYKGGWAALASMQTLVINEDIYGIASSSNYTTLFSFSEEDKKDDGFKFDSETGISDIKKEISNLSNYDGVNGANSLVSDNDSKPYYDTTNTNKLAGLINGEYAENYATWDTIAKSFVGATASWNDVFGEDCVQPLIIINNLRWYAEKAEANETNYSNYYVLVENEGDYKDGDIVTVNGKHYTKATEWDEETDYFSLNDVVNYGFVSSNKTIASSNYETITVKVKVSEGAVAYIYLIDGNDTKNTLGYTTPVYSFNYDEEGNVLDEPFDEDWKETEHRSHIVYKLRDDGLYENKKDAQDTKLYANLYNLAKSYNYIKFENNTFYNEKGEAVSFDDLVNGESYYPSATDHSKYANHYLTATDGTRVYEYVDGTYYYLEYDKDEEVYKTTVEVSNFDKSLANYESWNEELCTKVEDTHGEWVTVNFYIHTGSESKNYRLELWSGARTETGVDGYNAAKPGAVAFDYSAYSVSSSNYSTLIGEYEKNVINEYNKLLQEKGKLGELPSNNEKISYYEGKLVEDGVLTQAEIDGVKEKFGYKAQYYTYNLYDSAAFVPYNANTASEGQTGYNYHSHDYSEMLAYFTYDDYETVGGVSKLAVHNVFADYSAVDQSISLNSANEPTDDDEEESETKFGDLMLYIASIVLVVVLLITLVSILIQKLVKQLQKKKGTKANSKNNYRQRDRYIKKIDVVKEDDEVDETPVEETDETTEEVVEEVPVEETVETPVEEVPAEEVEETPAETPVEEAPVEETPVENGDDKPEDK